MFKLQTIRGCFRLHVVTASEFKQGCITLGPFTLYSIGQTDRRISAKTREHLHILLPFFSLWFRL